MTGPAMPRSTSARRTARAIVLFAGLLLPTLSLIPLGSIWLWQHGYLVYWAAFALLAVVAAYAVHWRLFSKSATHAEPQATGDEEDDDGRELGWSPLEEQAWGDVKALAREADPGKLASSDGLVELGREAIAAVARRMHPSRKEPLWQFTPPEALAIIERVSRRLRLFMIEKVPFGDRLTVAQVLQLYRWRGAIDYAEKAYDIWRLVRLANPITAATQEAREHFSKALVDWGREEISRRMAETYVREVGRAAIDLYGGRLRVTPEALGRHVSAESAADATAISAARAEPLRMLVAGQTGAGKSSLVNALASEARAAVDALPATASFAAYALAREGFPAALIIDSPGLDSGEARWQATIEKAADCDLVLWVVAVNRADRDVDKRVLEAFRQYFAERLNRRRPPLVLVATHIDRLRPFGEWSPPYDLAKADQPKAASIRAALSAAAADLGFAADEAVPIAMPPGAAPYNVEALWKRIAAELPEATRAQLLRCLHELRDTWSWTTVWSQATAAGRAIAGSLKSGSSR